jgi:hypothetical protein
MTDDYQNAPVPSEHIEAAQPFGENAVADEAASVNAAWPANENFAQNVPPASQAFEANAEESFRIAGSEKLEDLHGYYAAGTEAYETIAHAVRASLEEVAAGFGQFNSKLMEFGRVNAQNNVAFMQSIAGIRSVRDAVDVQTAYMREQYEAAAAQLRELQTLTTEIAEKATAPFKPQLAHSAQMFRCC